MIHCIIVPRKIWFPMQNLDHRLEIENALCRKHYISVFMIYVHSSTYLYITTTDLHCGQKEEKNAQK